MRRNSKQSLIEILRRNTTRSMLAAESGVQREYRLVSAGEDGMVFFWNIVASYNGNDLSKVENKDFNSPVKGPMNLLV